MATYSEDEPGKATMVGRNGSLTSGVNFTITCLELYERRTGSSSYYYLPIAEGYTSLDYFVGPYTMVQLVDAEGNELSPAASAATKQQVPFVPASAIGISGSEQCKAVE